jgi:hypothetical protein
MEIRWPSGTLQTMKAVTGDQVVAVKEDAK